MKSIGILIIILSFLCSCTEVPHATADFVTVENGRFYVNDKPYYYVGTNFWYGALIGSQGACGDRQRLLKELDFMKEKGITNLRVLVGADGLDGISGKVEPALQTSPGVYNDTILDGLDFFLSELGKRKMHAVLFLNNSWEWSGGFSQYLYWSGHGDVPMPNVKGWTAFSNYVAQYAKSEKAHQLFKNHIRNILTRVNRYTNRKYCDDPSIMAWQIGNEPRPFGEENKDAFAKWVTECAAFIKSIDSNHLVSVGSEGMAGCEGDIELWANIHADSHIDYLTIHIWPNNWGWIDKTNIAGTIDHAIDETHKYLDLHIEKAQKMNKPLVLEEFGLPRDSMQFTRESATSLRDRYYNEVFSVLKEHASEQDVFQGCNFWAWGGLAKPQHLLWQNGDDYMGDPGQEEQGLNSVYDTDTTVGLVANTVNEINHIIDRK